MNEAKVSHYLPELVGKTIKRICYLEPENQGNGSPQILFEFSDGSNFEIYGFGNHFSFTGLRIFQEDNNCLDQMFKESRSCGKASVIADKNGVTFSSKSTSSSKAVLELLKKNPNPKKKKQVQQSDKETDPTS